MALLRRGWLFAAFLVLGTAAHGELAGENDLKAAYAYNFMVLTTWPAEVPVLLRFCVTGPAESATPFRALDGKSAGERTVLVQNVATPAGALDCSVLFITSKESGRLGAWLAAAAKQPILTISDQGEGGDAMVNLRPANGKIVFDVNSFAATGARIGLSSQLIKLAASRR